MRLKRSPPCTLQVCLSMYVQPNLSLLVSCMGWLSSSRPCNPSVLALPSCTHMLVEHTRVVEISLALVPAAHVRFISCPIFPLLLITQGLVEIAPGLAPSVHAVPIRCWLCKGAVKIASGPAPSALHVIAYFHHCRLCSGAVKVASGPAPSVYAVTLCCWLCTAR